MIGFFTSKLMNQTPLSVNDFKIRMEDKIIIIIHNIVNGEQSSSIYWINN